MHGNNSLRLSLAVIKQVAMSVINNTVIKKFASAFLLLAVVSCAPTSNSPNASAVAQPTTSVSTDVQKTTVLEGLERPWSIAWLPDGAMLITERPGRLRIVRKGVLDPTPITGVPEIFAVNQGGLMEVSLHPRFAENRFVYLTYSHGTNEANRTRVARATFDGKALRDLKVIFEVNQAKSGGQHFGSRIIWLPDSTMLVAIGDGGNPPVQLDGDLILVKLYDSTMMVPYLRITPLLDGLMQTQQFGATVIVTSKDLLLTPRLVEFGQLNMGHVVEMS